MIRGYSMDFIVFDELTQPGDYWDDFLSQVASFKETYEKTTSSTNTVPFTFETFASRRYGVPVSGA